MADPHPPPPTPPPNTESVQEPCRLLASRCLPTFYSSLLQSGHSMQRQQEDADSSLCRKKGHGRHPGTPCPNTQPPHASVDNVGGQHTAASAAETHNGWHCSPIRLALFPNQLTPHLLPLYDYSDEGGRGGWGWVASAHSRCWSKRSRLMR